MSGDDICGCGYSVTQNTNRGDQRGFPRCKWKVCALFIGSGC